MPNKLTQIRRLLNETGGVVMSERIREDRGRDFSDDDVISAIRTAKDCATLSDDPTYDRYLPVGGQASNGTLVECVVTVRPRRIFVKSLYEVPRSLTCKCGGTAERQLSAATVMVNGRRVVVNEVPVYV